MDITPRMRILIGNKLRVEWARLQNTLRRSPIFHPDRGFRFIGFKSSAESLGVNRCSGYRKNDNSEEACSEEDATSIFKHENLRAIKVSSFRSWISNFRSQISDVPDFQINRFPRFLKAVSTLNLKPRTL